MPFTNSIPQPTPEERSRFDAKYARPGDGCWEWNGALADGYGRFKFRGKTMRAHRLLFSWTYPQEDITDQELDHFACDNRRCVRPAHVRPSTTRENVLRGASPSAQNARKEFCSKGHEFTLENTQFDERGKRNCRACWRIRRSEFVAQNRERVNAQKRVRYKPVTHEAKTCLHCGASFVPVRSTKRYCSEHCQAMANNRKQYAKRKGIQPPS